MHSIWPFVFFLFPDDEEGDGVERPGGEAVGSAAVFGAAADGKALNR
jgi:hypothetical protein